jgi:ubiquitin-protein ligase
VEPVPLHINFSEYGEPVPLLDRSPPLGSETEAWGPSSGLRGLLEGVVKLLRCPDPHARTRSGLRYLFRLEREAFDQRAREEVRAV